MPYKNIEDRRKYEKEYRLKNIHKVNKKVRNYHLKERYGLTEEQYSEMFIKQNGVCAICGRCETTITKYEKITKLSVDHNHLTGKIRSLLCNHCNHGLGNFCDSADLLRNATKYLESHI